MTARVSIICICIAITVGAWAPGGPHLKADPAILAWILERTGGQPPLTRALAWVTHAGSAPALIGITALGTIGLAVRRRWQEGMLLVAVVLSGRLAVELAKLLIERPRPDLVAFPVAVHSFSFPSGHAANSMITLMALAFVAAPPSMRRLTVAAAVILSLAIGLTRPMLGVHWPSDVIAGWAFGVAWVMAFAPLISRRGETGA